MMKTVKRYKKYVVEGWKGFLVAVLLLILIFLMIAVKNPGYQSALTIDYVYAQKTGGIPEESDFDLAIKYCENKIALNIQYPEKKDECIFLQNLQHEIDVKKEEQNA